MFVLGIQGSPRKNGNAEYLLTSFLKACEAAGAGTRVIQTRDLVIRPCRELLVCEKKGVCPIRDEMETAGYGLVKQADVVVLASPVFFYNVTAQAKIFIDRCQMFWGRKYKLGLKDPDRFSRQGFLLSVAASGGKRLFEGLELTAQYFFDAISADFAGSLTYKKVEDAGAIIVRPELDREIREAVDHLLTREKSKKRLVFISPRGRCRSAMAAAFAKEAARGRVRVIGAGLDSPVLPEKAVVRAMAQEGLDIKYALALSLGRGDSGRFRERDRVVWIGASDEGPPSFLPVNTPKWEIPAWKGTDDAALAGIRDQIRGRVRDLAGYW